MRKYECITVKAAAELEVPDAQDLMDYAPSEAEWRMCIVMVEDDEVTFLSMDGGEPEDNSFRRDGSWITPALNAAYQAGYDEALKASTSTQIPQ